MNCQNCENELEPQNRFCPNCGQKNHEINLRLKDLLGELVDEVFSLDNRVFRTLKSIITKPGEITVAYLEGKRIRFIPPVRLYLVLSILLVFSLSDSGPPAQSFSSYVSTSKTNGIKFRQIHFLFRNLEIDSITFSNLKNVSNEGLDSILRKQAVFSDPIFKSYVRKVQSLDNEKGWERTRSLEENMISTSLILYMPVLALILMLFFRNRYRFYVQHVIHSVYLNSVGFILTIVGNKFSSTLFPILFPGGKMIGAGNHWILFGEIFFLIFSTYIPLLVYSFFSLRNTYGETRLATTLKLFIIALLYSVCFEFLLDFLKVGFVFYET